MPISDRVVLITGAAGALGPAVCKAFAEAGVRLVLVGRELEKLEALAQSLGVAEDRILIHTADLIQPSEVNSLAESVKAKFGRADVLLHLIGGYKAGATIVDLNPTDVTEMLDQHLWTTLHVVRTFVPMMVTAGWGRVVTVSRPITQTPSAKGTPYSVGKAAQDSLIMTLAQELKGTGVTANSIWVKSIETKPPDPAKPRTSTAPEEIAAAMLWLCSDEAGATNGARIPIFGRE